MESEKNETSLNELIIYIVAAIKFVLRKWRLLLIMAFFGSVMGYTYAYLQKPIYSATLTYALDDEKGNCALSGALGLASSLGLDVGSSGSGAFAAANLMELMHSRYLIEKTLLSEVAIYGTKTTLADYYLLTYGYKKKWEQNEKLNNISFESKVDRSHFSRIQDSILGTIASSIDKNQLTILQKDKKISIGTIEVKSIDEKFAKLFCETLVSRVSEYYIDSKSKKAQNNVNILQRQVDSIRNELNNAIMGVASANDNIFNLNTALSIARTPSTKRQIDVQANTAILTQLVTNLEMAKVVLLKETPLFQIIDRPIFPLRMEKKSKLISLLLGGVISMAIVVLILIVKKKSENYII
jgi:hypothetical protein